ncbi:hypothetical protein MXB_2605, partial [Myxobolus squamalis]
AIIRPNSEISEIQSVWVENIINWITLNPFVHKNLHVYHDFLSVLSSKMIAEIIMEQSMDLLLINSHGIPVTSIIMAYGRAVLHRGSALYYESKGHIKYVKTIHMDFLNHVKNNDVKSYVELWNEKMLQKQFLVLAKSRQHPRNKELAALGAYLFESFFAANPTFCGEKLLSYSLEDKKQKESKYVVKKPTTNYKVSHLTPTKRAASLFCNLLYQKLSFKISANELPSLVPPVPVYMFDRGAYITDFHFNLFRGKRSYNAITQNRKRCNRGDLKLFLDTISSSGLIGWKINVDILELMIKLFINNINEPNLKHYAYYSLENYPGFSEDYSLQTDKLRNENVDVDPFEPTLNETPNYKKLCAENFSLWSNLHKNLIAANYFSDKTFYIPYNIDFRGRFYPMPTVAHYYSGDNFRALLKYAHKIPLGESGLFWLKYHLVTKCGVLKDCNGVKRVEYANTIMNELIKVAQQPLIFTWWMKVESPWQVLATCIEIIRAIGSGSPQDYMCSFPVHQDGSCNGLQHYAAIGKSIAESTFVHLKQRFSYSDLYNDVATLVRLSTPCSESDQDTISIAKRATSLVERSLVKKTVMTYVYGVTRYGAREQIISQIVEEGLFNELNEKHSLMQIGNFLSGSVLKCVETSFSSATEIMKWLRKCSKFFSSNNMATSWNTPLNLFISQPYYRKKSYPIVSEFGQHWISEDILTDRDSKIDLAKQKMAIPPNYIHSMDATHMVLTQSACFKRGVTFAAVHDSFWVHPANVEELSEILRDEFIRMYEPKVLENFKRDMEKMTGKESNLILPKEGPMSIECSTANPPVILLLDSPIREMTPGNSCQSKQ